LTDGWQDVIDGRDGATPERAVSGEQGSSVIARADLPTVASRVFSAGARLERTQKARSAQV
jgi:hypothetical protein